MRRAAITATTPAMVINVLVQTGRLLLKTEQHVKVTRHTLQLPFLTFQANAGLGLSLVYLEKTH